MRMTVKLCSCLMPVEESYSIPLPLCSSYTHPRKEDAVAEHTTRFKSWLLIMQHY